LEGDIFAGAKVVGARDVGFVAACAEYFPDSVGDFGGLAFFCAVHDQDFVGRRFCFHDFGILFGCTDAAPGPHIYSFRDHATGLRRGRDIYVNGLIVT